MEIEELVEAMVEARLRKIKVDEELAALTQQAKALERKQPAIAASPRGGVTVNRDMHAMYRFGIRIGVIDANCDYDRWCQTDIYACGVQAYQLGGTHEKGFGNSGSRLALSVRMAENYSAAGELAKSFREMQLVKEFAQLPPVFAELRSRIKTRDSVRGNVAIEFCFYDVLWALHAKHFAGNYSFPVWDQLNMARMNELAKDIVDTSIAKVKQ
jgi:hypothetical protein